MNTTIYYFLILYMLIKRKLIQKEFAETRADSLHIMYLSTMMK